jgi:hypothetical protein
MSKIRLAMVAGIVGVPLAAFLTSGPTVSATGSVESGFLLGGTAQNALDPENSANQVIKIDTTSPLCNAASGFQNCAFGTVSRKLNVRISALDNMLEFKSFFQNRSCGGGSPRFALSIDLNGDGTADGDAWGYTAPPFAGCAPNRWQYDDLTDELPRWDASQLAALGFPSAGAICTNPLFSTNPIVCPVGGFQTHSGYVPWVVFEAVLRTLFPFHKICSSALVDDSSWLPGAAGVAYYDIISMGRATWEDWADSAGRGFAKGCSAPDHGDDDHDGDHNHNHCADDGDRDWHDRHK